jgi:polyisoprenyl-phosphate glycosyltransferase
MKEAPFVSVIIPCFNEQESVAAAYQRVAASLAGDWNKGHEILFINDGSKDATLDILKQLAQQDGSLKILSFSRNFGHQAAVGAGISHSKGDVAIILDADMQDPPELIADMVDLYRQNPCNVVYGVRKERKGETAFKRITARWFYRLLNRLADMDLNTDTGDFRLIDRKVIDAFNGFSEKNKYIRGIISWMGFKQLPLHYTRDARLHGKTKYNLRKMLHLASIAMFYFSKKPLKTALTMGFISIIIGILLTVYVLYVQLGGGYTVPGWASTVITIIFFGGVQLLTIGVVGEYIGNILDEVKNRPEYIVDEKVNME